MPMARDLEEHERMCWAARPSLDMINQELRYWEHFGEKNIESRLYKIRLPQRLAAFMRVAGSNEKERLFKLAVERAFALGIQKDRFIERAMVEFEGKFKQEREPEVAVRKIRFKP